MRADLSNLKQFIRPMTAEQVRASLQEYESAPDEPGFVAALESEMRDEFLACAHAVARQNAELDARQSAVA